MKKICASLMVGVMLFTGVACTSDPTVTTESTTDPTAESYETSAETEPELKWPADITPEELVAQLSLEEKAAQMVQGQLTTMSYAEMEQNCYGSVLSITHEWPAVSQSKWIMKIRAYQRAALLSDAGIPYIYGQDSVHGLYAVNNSIIYPHNINVGAANDPELTYEYGKLVGSDMKHVGTILNFGPCIASAQDPRWGRTYESFSSDLGRTEELGLAFVQGQLDEGVVVCLKHFIADGHAEFGTGEASGGTNRLIDRGIAWLTEDEISELMDVYGSMAEAGAQSIMISHSALNGVKMHENGEYILRFKEEYNFDGVVLSDWESIHNCSGETLYEQVVNAINAGIDMLMEPDAYEECRGYIVEAVNNGDIPIERVDDAVTRIVRLKINAGLFTDPMLENTNPSYEFNSDHGREVARTLAAESFVVLKAGEHLTIPSGERIFVAGPAAQDTGALCGGWTIDWNGVSDTEEGLRWVDNATTILEGLEEAAQTHGFEIVTDPAQIDTCSMIILCVGERPYAEWNGDTEDLLLTGELGLSGNEEAIEFARSSGLPTVTLIVAGRNVILGNNLDYWDSCIMCYLPGTEGGHAIADVLCGDAEFKGTLPMPYYSDVEQIGTGECWHDVGWSALG